MIRSSLLTGFLTLLIFYATAQKKVPVPGKQYDPSLIFDSYIRQALTEWNTPGLSVVVVKDSSVVFKKAYGVQSTDTKAPYSTNTLSTCASTTKAMTAVCMAMLVDEGKVKWNDRVADLLPGFRLSDYAATAEITVKDLFTHNTGLGNADLLWVFGYDRTEILKRMKTIPPAYSLRSGFIYQNLMYIVAGELIRQVSGKSWDEFITERIFRPLEMNNTYADHSKIPPAAMQTTPHFRDEDNGDIIKPISYITTDNVGAAGGVWSCIDDMSKWLKFLNDSARVNGKRLLKPETFAELFKPQSIVTSQEFYPTQRIIKPHWMTYGLGWFQQDYRGKMVQFHTGSLAGLVAICGMIPDEKTSVYIFGNLDHSEIRHALMYKAFDLWSFHQDNDWSHEFYQLYKGIRDTAKKKEAEQLSKRVPDTKPSLPLQDYAGKYNSIIYGEAELVFHNDSLTIHFPDNIYTVFLKHWHFDTFRGYFNYWWAGKTFVQFMLNADGKVSGFSFDGIIYSKKNN